METNEFDIDTTIHMLAHQCVNMLSELKILEECLKSYSRGRISPKIDWNINARIDESSATRSHASLKRKRLEETNQKKDKV